jgi:drug/metabolite transporter (DMT)-like permease
MQGSNLCFALGQVGYRRLPLKDKKPRDTFALAYLGALLVTVASLLFGLGQWPTTLNIAQVGTLAYLGIVASGIGFFLWNVGATRTSASVLAVFNNVKIPLAIAVSLLIFGESANLVRLTIGGGLMLFALWLPSSTSSIHGPCRR